MLAVARASAPGARFVQGDLCDLPFADASYDVVVCALALCHVPDLASAVSELARVAARGGRVVLTDPHPLAVAVIGQAFFPTGRGTIAFVRNHYHSFGTWLESFDAAGLRVIHCHEGSYGEEHIGGLPGQFVPGAAKQALVGLPFSIVWELERT
jgi:SAM-dependent methyltransferase